eukprot:2248929-Rhodomonas_salina.1
MRALGFTNVSFPPTIAKEVATPLRSPYAMSGTGLAYALNSRLCVQMCGTDLVYAATSHSPRAMFGTELVYAATSNPRYR